MTDQLQKSIKECNLRPANKAAAAALLRMGETPDQSQLHVLQLAETKMAEEGLEPPDGTASDLYDLKDQMTPEWAQKITEHLTEEGMDVDYLMEIDAPTLMDWITNPIPLEEFSPHWAAQLTRD